MVTMTALVAQHERAPPCSPSSTRGVVMSAGSTRYLQR